MKVYGLMVMSLILLSALCTACGDHGEPNHHAKEAHSHHEVSARALSIAASQGDAVSGATLFASTCKSCHGADGEGGVYEFSLVESARIHSDEELAQTILDGEGDMPAYAQRFDDQQIADLLAHLRAF